MVRPAARISVVIRNVVWVGIVAHAGFVPLFLWLDHPGLALFNVGSVASWVAAALANRLNRSTLAMWILWVEVVAHACVATAVFGWDSGYQYYLIPLVPFVMFNDRLKAGPVWAASLAVFSAIAALRTFAPTAPMDPRIAWLTDVANLAIPLLALGLITFYFRLASVTVEQSMARMALTDPLTGLYNRRHMDDLLEAAHARYATEGKPFSVILADVDHFKGINDSSGHDAGDRVLRAVAKLFGEQLRESDAVARWGGEEFLVLLPASKPDSALDVAQRLCKAAEERLRALAGVAHAVTLTLGVATMRPNLDVAGLIKTADAALYSGKASGRNRVVVGAMPEAALAPRF